MSLQPLPSLLATTVLSGRGVANETSFANTTADLAIGNATAGAIIGVNQSAITVSSPGSVIGGVVASLSGTAISVGSNADADAGALTSSSLVGISGNSTTGNADIGGTGSIQGSLLATLTAAGTSTDGNSDATAGALEAIGIRSSNLAINGDGTIAGISQLTQSAIARTTAGSSNADAQVDTVKGLVAGGTPSITVDGTGALYGAASLVSSATAVTIGDDATIDTATATQSVSTGAIGLDLTGATASSIGGAAAITGQAEVVGSANASATSANASAVAGATGVIGLKPSDSVALQGNSNAIITASGSGVFTAKANTTSGGSQATADGSIYGVNGGAGQLAIGGNGVLNASSLFDGTAIAATIDGVGNNASASVTPTGGASIGLFLGNTSEGLSTNGNASLVSTAQSNQVATASITSGGNASASVASSGGVLVKGISGPGAGSVTVINIDGIARDFISSSTLNANASASSVTGSASANDSEYRAIGTDSSRILIGGNSVGQLRSTAKTTESLTATSISGNATSEALGSFVQGVNLSDINVAGSSGVAIAKAELDLTQLAKTTSGSSASVDLPPQAFNINGLRDGNISFGSNGSVEASAQTKLKLQALNTTGNADAFTLSGTSGSDLRTTGNHVTVNGSGNIISAATVTGLAEASTVTGPSRSGGTSGDVLSSLGMFAEAGNISFSVAGSGSITGSSEIGTSSNPFQVKASSVDGVSQATLLGDPTNGPRSLGVEGRAGSISSEATRLRTSAGLLTGVSTAYFQFNAESINGNSTSGFIESPGDKDSFSTYGVRNANLIVDSAAGSSSSADGSASSYLNSTSKTVSGDSASRLAIESKGIFSVAGIHSIQAANTSGQSQISASSLASTVMGNSIASSLRNSAANTGLAGIDNYSVNSLGTGSILANSSALLKSGASSVSGNATGFSTI